MTPPSPRRPLNLKRELLRRITLFTLVLFLVAAVWLLWQAGSRVRHDLHRTGDAMRQLINSEVTQHTTAFDRSLESIELSSLVGLGEIVPFCVSLTDIYERPATQRCFAAGDAEGSADHPLRPLLAWAVGPARFTASIGSFPGIRLGTLSITPNLDWEAAHYARQLRNLLMLVAGVLSLNVLVVVPVRRALQPTEEILAGLSRMEAGDLGVRLPDCALIELHRISTVFNHLAERLQQTSQAQQHLAARLLEVREEERRHLARELHDEFGQWLTSLQAEAAYVHELAEDGLPLLRPCAEAIARTTAHMLSALQLLLHQLRPVGLDEFGLVANLESLVAGWNRRSDGACLYQLTVSGPCDDLGDTLQVNLFRIVQESLTNATRHGNASRVEVRLTRAPDGRHLALSIDNDGAAVDPASTSGGSGFGLLGMRERVLALGGRLALHTRPEGGLRVSVEIPLQARSLTVVGVPGDFS